MVVIDQLAGLASHHYKGINKRRNENEKMIPSRLQSINVTHCKSVVFSTGESWFLSHFELLN